MERVVITGEIPSDFFDYEKKFEKQYRAIAWRDELIKSYKYSNQLLDTLGYHVAKSVGNDIDYYNCEKGTLLFIKYLPNIISIRIEWWEKSVRPETMYLMYCNIKKQSNEEVKKDLIASFKEDALREKQEQEKREKERIEKESRLNSELFFEGKYRVYFKKQKSKVIIYSPIEINATIQYRVLERIDNIELKKNKTYYFDYVLYANRSKTIFDLRNIGEVMKFKGQVHPNYQIEISLDESDNQKKPNRADGSF